MRRTACLFIALFFSSIAHADESLLHQWQLVASHIKENRVAPLAGTLEGTIVGPVAFNKDEPKALLLDGNSKKKHRIDITDDLKKAGLPDKQISVEAWVRIDKPQEWSGLAGAFQDNALLKKDEQHGIEKTGAKLRALMPWMPKRNIKGAQAAY